MYYLSSVSFHENEHEHVGGDYYIYVKDGKTSYSSTSFYDALQLCQSDQVKEEGWRSIVVNRTQSIEFHFRSYERKEHIISITVHLPTYDVDIYSYIWQTYRKTYLKCNYEDYIPETTAMALLKRIYIKHDGKITFLHSQKV